MSISNEPMAPFVFNIDELSMLADKYLNTYSTAAPFPHAVIDNFLDLQWAKKALSVFPNQYSDIWLDWKIRDTVHQPKKQGLGHASRLVNVSPYLQNILFAFNSYPFLSFLEKLTGIAKLLPDPHFHGGGLHQILSGGKLSIHTDFNDLRSLDIYRRINVLFYLNEDWEAGYEGNLELWDENVQSCIRSIAPIFNRLVIFNTNKKSFHGHPIPLNTPPGITRKSIALYYYTAKPAPDAKHDELTDWREPTVDPVPISP
jgi:hypothetical protein